jgi:hypothetical protein
MKIIKIFVCVSSVSLRYFSQDDQSHRSTVSAAVRLFQTLPSAQGIYTVPHGPRDTALCMKTGESREGSYPEIRSRPWSPNNMNNK